MLRVLGLDVCSDTMVGNDMMRGVSGGQRKRVTTGLFQSHNLSMSTKLFTSSVLLTLLNLTLCRRNDCRAKKNIVYG